MGNFFLYIGCAVVADWASRQIFGNKPLFEVKTEVVETAKEEAAE
jgi:hypothetical protein